MSTSSMPLLKSASKQTGGTSFILEEKFTPRLIIISYVWNLLIGIFLGPICWFKASQHSPCTTVHPHAHENKFSSMRGPFRPPHPGKIWHGFPPLLRSEINKLSLFLSQNQRYPPTGCSSTPSVTHENEVLSSSDLIYFHISAPMTQLTRPGSGSFYPDPLRCHRLKDAYRDYLVVTVEYTESREQF